MTTWVCAVATLTARQQPQAVLVLHTYGYDAPFRLPFDGAFARALQEVVDPKTELYIETIDASRFRGPDQAPKMRTYLRERYAGKRIAVVAAVYDRALGFLLDPSEPLFPGAPVVALVTSVPEPLPAHVSIIHDNTKLGDTAALAVRLHAGPAQIVLVDGAPPGPTNDAVYDAVREQIERSVPNSTIVAVRNLPLGEVRDRLAAVPSGTPILILRQLLGAHGEPIATFEAVRELAPYAAGPIYVSTDQQIGVGAIGGVVLSMEEEGGRLARLALRVAREPSRQVAAWNSRPAPIFDWRQLQRWGIKHSSLPPNSIVRFRELSAWEQYRSYVVGAAVVVALQTGLIAVLFVQRRKRRRIETALRDGERALRHSLETNQDLAGRLITAQEEERTRIARDLHDDLSQQLAAVSIMLSGLKRNLRPLALGTEIDDTIATVQERTATLANAIRHISHELHPVVLLHTGLPAALSRRCSEIQQHHGFTVTCSATGDLNALEFEVTLCLYRVAQEALTNVVRHARANVVGVEVWRSEGVVGLRICDDGVGFVAAERAASGLGLRSIDERVRLFGGDTAVESRPGAGTTITVQIPLTPIAAVAPI